MSKYPERISISPVHRQKREDDFYLVDRAAFPGKGREYVDADLLTAAEARIEELEAGPVVKPLEWRESYGVLRADTPFGSYKTSLSGKILTLGVAPMAPQAACAGLDDAKAWAQIDYERRIRAALKGTRT